MPDASVPDPDHSLSALKPDCPTEWTAREGMLNIAVLTSNTEAQQPFRAMHFLKKENAVMIVVEVIITFSMLEIDSGFVWDPKLRPDPQQGHVCVVLRSLMKTATPQEEDFNSAGDFKIAGLFPTRHTLWPLRLSLMSILLFPTSGWSIEIF